MKKFFVVTVLFALPIVAYLFFSSGVNNFARLPVLTENVKQTGELHSLKGEELSLEGHITILGFPGKQPMENLTGAYHLAEKIYEPYYQFKDLQFVFVAPESSEEDIRLMKNELGQIVDMSKWKFFLGTEEAVKQLFEGLETNRSLRDDLSSTEVFIIDKNADLRGRDDDEDHGMLYGYDTGSVAVLNNKMNDDVKVILAEYRLELKKYKSNRSN